MAEFHGPGFPRRNLHLSIALRTGLLLLAGVAVSISAKAIYVAPNGGGAGTVASPYSSIGSGVNAASAGDTVYVRGGTYNESVRISNKNGTAGNFIVIRAYPGEIPILDGQNSRPSSKWDGLFQTSGSSYIELNGFEVRNSTGRGIHTLSGSNIRVLNSKWYSLQGSAMNIRTSYSLIEDNTIYNSCLENSSSPGASGSGWPGVLMVDRTNNCTVRGNIVYNSWGEGIIDLVCDYSTIEDNIVWNNWALGIYLDHSANSIVRRNIVYYDSDKRYWRNSDRPAIGIGISNEAYYSDVTVSRGRNQTIVNNFVFRCGDGISYFKVGSMSGDKLLNTLIAHNTIVDNYNRGINLGDPNGGNHENTRVFNNIVVGSGTMAQAGNLTNVSFSNNAWSKSPESKFSGNGDVVGDLMLTRTGSTAAHQLSGEYFKLASNSPCINKARTMTEVTVDFFKVSRGSSPDIGGHEYSGATGVQSAVSRTAQQTSRIASLNGSQKLIVPHDVSGVSFYALNGSFIGRYEVAERNSETTIDIGKISAGRKTIVTRFDFAQSRPISSTTTKETK